MAAVFAAEQPTYFKNGLPQNIKMTASELTMRHLTTSALSSGRNPAATHTESRPGRNPKPGGWPAYRQTPGEVGQVVRLMAGRRQFRGTPDQNWQTIPYVSVPLARALPHTSRTADRCYPPQSPNRRVPRVRCGEGIRLEIENDMDHLQAKSNAKTTWYK